MAPIHRRSVRHALGPRAQMPTLFAASTAVAPILPKMKRANAIAPAEKWRRATTWRGTTVTTAAHVRPR